MKLQSLTTPFSTILAGLVSLAMLVLVSLSLSLSSLSVKANGAFPDVPSSYTFHSQIMNLLDYQVVGGFPDGKFYPERTVTRGQMAKFVKNGIYGSSYSNINCAGFGDIDPGNSFFSEIMTLKCEGVISGFSDNTFKPENVVTRGQAMKFIIEGLRKKLADPQFLSIQQGFNNFSDVQPSNTFYTYVMSAYSNYLVSGYNSTTFGVNDPVKRGAMSKMVWNGMLSLNYKFDLVQPSMAGSLETYLTDVRTPDLAGQRMYYAPNNENKGVMVIRDIQFYTPVIRQNLATEATLIIKNQQPFPTQTTYNYTSDPIIELFTISSAKPVVTSELSSLSYPGSDFVRGYYGFAYDNVNNYPPSVQVLIYAIKNNNLILLNKTVENNNMQSYHTQCLGQSTQVSSQYYSCMNTSLTNDNQLQLDVINTRNELLTTYSLVSPT